MSLKSIDRDWDTSSRYRALNGGVTKQIIDAYTAEMTHEDDTLDDILRGAPGLRQYAKHPTVTGAIVLETRGKQEPGTAFWHLEVEYSTEIEQLVNPLSIPPVITGGFNPRNIVRLVDAYGKLKMNTAGDLFDDPPPEVTVHDRVYKIQKNVPTTLPDWVDGYADCVNNDDVKIKGRSWPPGTVLYVPGDIGIDDVGGPLKNIAFCALSFELHCRADGWVTQVPNRGFFEIVEVPAVSSLSQIGQTNPGLVGTPVNPQPDDQVVGKKKGKYYIRRKIHVGSPKHEPVDPVALDKNGRAIAVPTIDNMVLLEFDDYEKRPFNVLPLK